MRIAVSRLPPRVYAGDSPIELTELGRNISTRLNGKDWAEEHAANLREEIKGREPYEVQEMCFEYANERSTQARGSRPARNPQPTV